MFAEPPPVPVTRKLWVLGAAAYPVYLYLDGPEGAIFEGGVGAVASLVLEQLDAPIGRLHARHIAPIGKRQLGALSALLELAQAAAPPPGPGRGSIMN